MMGVMEPRELPTWEMDRLPEPFGGFAAVLPQMRPGAPGKVGVLFLRFELRGGRTCLVDSYNTGPQRVHRVLYLDDRLQDMAFVFVQSVAGGILQGDRLAVEIQVGPGARVHVTSQAAVKIYRMEADYATQRTLVRVEESGYLELFNDPIIPYRGARFYNTVDIEADPTATVLYSEALTPGRVASGESFEYELIRTRLSARMSGGPLRALDVNVLEPRRFPTDSLGLFGAYTFVGSLLVLEPEATVGTVADSIERSVAQAVTVNTTGVSKLPRGDGAFVRTLGHSSEEVEKVIAVAWRSARHHLLGVGLPRVRSAKYGFELIDLEE